MRFLKHKWQRIRQSHLAKNVGWMFFGQCAGYVLQGVYFIILARLLGVMQYGIFAGAFAFVNLVARYSTLGTGSLFQRYVSVDKAKFAIYWGNILIATGALGAVVVLGLYVAGLHILNAESASLVILAAVSNCLGTQLTICAGIVFQTFDKMHLTALMNLLANLLRALAAVGMLLILGHASAWQFAWASAIVSVIVAGVAIGLVTMLMGTPQASVRVFRTHLLEGAGFAFANSTMSAFNDLDKTMLSHYGMNVANGIYTTAYRVIDIASMPVYSLKDASMPMFFRIGSKGVGESATYARKISKRSIQYGLLASVSLFLIAPLLPKVMGPTFAETANAVRWLCLIVPFRGAHEFAGCALTGAGLQRYRTGTQVIAALVNFGLNLWLIPLHGWRGAAWASLATDGFLGILNYCVLKAAVLRDTRPQLEAVAP